MRPDIFSDVSVFTFIGDTLVTAVKLASPVRPHTLHLPASEQPSHARNLTPDSGAARLRMASCESIGSCSLDVDATISDVSELIEEGSASEQTLHSVPLSSLKTPDRDLQCSAASSPGTLGVSSPASANGTKSPKSYTPTYIKADAIPSLAVNGNLSSEEKAFNGVEPVKKPSYLSLACSISGYSGITTYDSKLREGFRSREHSPGRLGLVRSREVSPSRFGADYVDTSTQSKSYFTSECGNFLLPTPRSSDMFKLTSNLTNGVKQGESVASGCVNGFSSPSDKSDQDLDLGHTVNIVNGNTNKLGTMNGNHFTNGSVDSCRGKENMFSNYITKEESIISESRSESTSSIKQSSRYFLSSMLNSGSTCETFSSRNSVNRHSSVISDTSSLRSPLTMASRKFEVHENSSFSAKCSPESPKTGSKDSLSAPSSSPLKRSPGTVKVVEFTSQEKSYIHTKSSVSTHSTTTVDLTSTTSHSDRSPNYSENSFKQEIHHTNNLGPSVSDGNVCKSFIVQRVERLYGPGALAQGFFKRTVERQKEKEVETEDSKMSPTAVRLTESTPALPVLRHLRPEFRAQLTVARPAKKFLDKECTSHQLNSKDIETNRLTSEIPSLQQQISVESLPESLPDLQPAAPEVVLPIDQIQVLDDTSNLSATVESVDTSQEKDGHHFLKMLKKETDRLNGLATIAETDLANEQNLSEEILGKLRAASGQARLLMKQKLQQFEGLCHKNINQNPDEPFPTTREDLAGFWDMVSLQIDHVDSLFKELEVLRNNNWLQDKVLPKETAPTKRRSTPTKKTSKPSPVNEEARKARDEARRKMMEEKRKAMREKATESKNDNVEIFIPQENGK